MRDSTMSSAQLVVKMISSSRIHRSAMRSILIGWLGSFGLLMEKRNHEVHLVIPGTFSKTQNSALVLQAIDEKNNRSVQGCGHQS